MEWIRSTLCSNFLEPLLKLKISKGSNSSHLHLIVPYCNIDPKAWQSLLSFQKILQNYPKNIQIKPSSLILLFYCSHPYFSHFTYLNKKWQAPSSSNKPFIPLESILNHIHTLSLFSFIPKYSSYANTHLSIIHFFISNIHPDCLYRNTECRTCMRLESERRM